MALAVVGAHLSGEPLNGQLVALGARLLETTRTAPTYRLYALPDTEPAKPGLVGGGPPAGRGIELEIWELVDRELRAHRRGRAGAAVDRDDHARGRPRGEGLSLRVERDPRTPATSPQYGGWRAYRAAQGTASAR